MSKYFALGTLQGISSVKLDSKGCATVPYTVTNVSGRALDGRAVLISLPQTKPLSGPVEKGWVKIDGSPDRHFEVGKQETFTVNICVPPNSVAGNYTFRLDAVWVNEPDVGDEGPHLGFTVAAPTTTTTRFPLWLIPVILVVVIGIGAGLWLALRKGKDVTPGAAGDKMVPVKPVVGQSLQQAIVTLDAIGLEVTPSFTGDYTQPVMSQNPAPPASVKPGSSVTLTFPAASSSVGGPSLITGDRAHLLIQEYRIQARQRGIKPQ